MLWTLLTLAITTSPARQSAPASAPAADCHAAPSAYDCAVAQVARQDFAAAIETLTTVVLNTGDGLKTLDAVAGTGLTATIRPNLDSFREAGLA